MDFKHVFRIIVIMISFSFFISCDKEEEPQLEGPIINTGFIGADGVKEYSFDTDANSGQMYQANETEAERTSPDRLFNITHVVRVKPIDAFTLEVANFAPTEIENMLITATIDGVSKKIKLFNIKKIRAHAVQEIKYSFLDESTGFQAMDGSIVDLKEFKAEGILPNKITFDFEGDTPLIQKLKTLAPLKWKIKFHDFNTNDDPASNWIPVLRPEDTRRLSSMMINFGYIMASEKFKEQFYKQYFTDNDDVAMTSDAIKAAYKRLIDLELLNVSICVNVYGLGGGSTFGVADFISIDGIRAVGLEVAGHEIGHCIDYTHTSNFCSWDDHEGKPAGMMNLTSRMARQLLSEFPITNDNYYMPSDFEK